MLIIIIINYIIYIIELYIAIYGRINCAYKLNIIILSQLYDEVNCVQVPIRLRVEKSYFMLYI